MHYQIRFYNHRLVFFSRRVYSELSFSITGGGEPIANCFWFGFVFEVVSVLDSTMFLVWILVGKSRFRKLSKCPSPTSSQLCVIMGSIVLTSLATGFIWFSIFLLWAQVPLFQCNFYAASALGKICHNCGHAITPHILYNLLNIWCQLCITSGAGDVSLSERIMPFFEDFRS